MSSQSPASMKLGHPGSILVCVQCPGTTDAWLALLATASVENSTLMGAKPPVGNSEGPQPGTMIFRSSLRAPRYSSISRTFDLTPSHVYSDVYGRNVSIS